MYTHYYAGPDNVVIDDGSRCGWNRLFPCELTRIVRAPEGVYAASQQSMRDVESSEPGSKQYCM
jgi:hypothetical protein